VILDTMPWCHWSYRSDLLSEASGRPIDGLLFIITLHKAFHFSNRWFYSPINGILLQISKSFKTKAIFVMLIRPSFTPSSNQCTMDPLLQHEPLSDEAYSAWASKFINFEFGEHAAEAFQGPIPDTSNLEKAAAEAAAALSGFWDQHTHPELSAGEDWQNAPDIATDEFWQRFGLDVPAAQLKLPPPSHTSDYSDITMCDDPPPALGPELPPRPQLQSRCQHTRRSAIFGSQSPYGWGASNLSGGILHWHVLIPKFYFLSGPGMPSTIATSTSALRPTHPRQKPVIRSISSLGLHL
jgi:hypothetical protein